MCQLKIPSLGEPCPAPRLNQILLFHTHSLLQGSFTALSALVIIQVSVRGCLCPCSSLQHELPGRPTPNMSPLVPLVAPSLPSTWPRLSSCCLRDWPALPAKFLGWTITKFTTSRGGMSKERRSGGEDHSELQHEPTESIQIPIKGKEQQNKKMMLCAE